MSMWTRLFARSKSPQPTSKPRLALEPLDAREVPAAIAGGSSAVQEEFPYQVSFRHAAPAAPTAQFASNPAPESTPRVNAADYSAVVFVGGWGSSMSQSDAGSLTTPEPRPEPVVTGFETSDGTRSGAFPRGATNNQLRWIY